MFSRIYIFQSNIAETIFQHRFRFRRQFRSLTKRTKTESLKTHNIPDVRADINIRACFWLLPGHNWRARLWQRFRNSKYVSLSRRFHGACGALSEQRHACVWAQTTRGQRDRSTFVDGRTTRELIQVERHGYSARAVRQPSRGRSKTGSKQKRNTHKMKKETREQHKHDIIRLTITTTVHQFHLFYCQNKQR